MDQAQLYWIKQHYTCVITNFSVKEIGSSKCRVQLKRDGTRWRRGGKVKGKLANGVGSQYLHTTSEHGVSSITTADAHTSAASSRLNWRPRRFKWSGPFRRKTKSGFCACGITFQTQCTAVSQRAEPAGQAKDWQRWNYSRRQNQDFLFLCGMMHCCNVNAPTCRDKIYKHSVLHKVANLCRRA